MSARTPTSSFTTTVTSRLRGESGQSAVELALIMPLLLVLIFAVVDLGKAFNYWNDANQVAGEGARYAAVDKVPGGGSLETYLRSRLDTSELRNGGTDAMPGAATVNVCYQETNGDLTKISAGDSVKVTVSFNYSWLPFLRPSNSLNKLGGFTTVANVKGTATMRLEANPASTPVCAP